MREKGDLAAAIWHAVGMLCLHRASAAAATAGLPGAGNTSPRKGSPMAGSRATSPAGVGVSGCSLYDGIVHVIVRS